MSEVPRSPVATMRAPTAGQANQVAIQRPSIETVTDWMRRPVVDDYGTAVEPRHQEVHSGASDWTMATASRLAWLGRSAVDCYGQEVPGR